MYILSNSQGSICTCISIDFTFIRNQISNSSWLWSTSYPTEWISGELH